MKTVLNLVALLAICGAAFFSYSNKGKVAVERELQEDAQTAVDNLKNSLAEKSEELDAQKAKLSDAQDAKAEMSAKIENLNSTKTVQSRELASVEGIVDKQIVELEGLQKILDETNGEVEGGLTMDEIPGRIQELTDQINESESELSNLTAAREGAQSKSKSLREDASRLSSAIAERASRIASNQRESTVLAANSDWNFVYLSKSSGFSVGDQLIAKRGANYIGKLKVVSVEPSGVVADVVDGSLRTGARVRPGDRAIREVALTK